MCTGFSTDAQIPTRLSKNSEINKADLLVFENDRKSIFLKIKDKRYNDKCTRVDERIHT